VTGFGYWRDRLFLAGCSLYAVNRWLVLPHVRNRFLHGHFNDLLLIPCALPPLLWMQRSLGLRQNDDVPSFAEISLYLLVWSVLFEAIGPHIMRRVTGDPLDVVAYIVGGLLAGVWWNRARNAATAPHEL
jgi:hypothetical protein